MSVLLTVCFVSPSFRSSQSAVYSSMSASEPCPERTEDVDENSAADLAPLNLSTRNKDKERSQTDDRLTCSETGKLKRDELPLNLSLRASHSTTAEDVQHRVDIELDEEPCDQRQTAALALCQLAIASAAASSCDLSTADRAAKDSPDVTRPSSPEKTKHTRSKGLKRSLSGQAENNCHKQNKRAKAPGRLLRRRLRCC